MKKFTLSLFAVVLLAAGCSSSKQSSYQDPSSANINIESSSSPPTVSEQKSDVQTYENKEWGFKFSYASNWQIEQGAKYNFSPKPLLYLKLVNTKDFPIRGQQYIEVMLVKQSDWKIPGGEIHQETFKQIQNSKKNQTLYFNLYQSGSIADFYDHDQNDKLFFDAFYQEGKTASDQLKSVSGSLQPF